MSEKKKIVYIDMDGVLVDLKAEFDKWFGRHPHLIEKYKIPNNSLGKNFLPTADSTRSNIKLNQIPSISIYTMIECFEEKLNIDTKSIDYAYDYNKFSPPMYYDPRIFENDDLVDKLTLGGFEVEEILELEINNKKEILNNEIIFSKRFMVEILLI